MGAKEFLEKIEKSTISESEKKGLRQFAKWMFPEERKMFLELIKFTK